MRAHLFTHRLRSRRVARPSWRGAGAGMPRACRCAPRTLPHTMESPLP
ncbi:hypothetical protein BURMUCGD2M_6210 [Burkholderia multivorans CGD2M]|uniref:Uncharacterized protein n=1 Tax=Burkholderia multivorans CGD2 TaxID=513052 RepID=B9BWY5_9BURK|nr:hypothetical protein BURMUCGD1_6059 [Burkholderia multivorans CGD1]EEE04805.1 hypothetical protein BURMUCGD2_6222 [Burkholderia multivorans CGD2]EEE13490.1 hypothetical protein BURMUCGD2M_6210 [Burkholderia multivorans CGD2M]